ncbi:MAG: acylphosphatase [Candidatus Zixiibacteriota bacterium]
MISLKTVAVEVTIFGRVQGVGYRYFCARVARELGLTGWVKNNHNDSVSAWLEGDKSVVESAIAELRLGPSSAHVIEVKVSERDPKGQFQSFEISH